ncbi:sensor domain-containing diguanylate cyclase [Oleisolibacter albus]|uniref:sensor domain-containing diguanylate cyclase n=1 Tax=Oleisolibacter albus TaxID=2171757 RepID=UPI000DF34301|nr:diguanylate cyclase [Oleisolibacter albus]
MTSSTARPAGVGPSPLRLPFLIALLLLFPLWIGIGLHIRYNDRTARTAVERDVSNLARSFEEHVSGLLERLDERLLQVRRDWPGTAAADLRPEGGHRSDQILGFVILDRQGTVLVSTVAADPVGSPRDSGEAFQTLRADPSDRLLVGRVQRDTTRDAARDIDSSGWMLHLSRPLLDRDGRFDGVISLVIDPGLFSRFYDSIDMGVAGAIVLVGTDGWYRARSPLTANTFDRPMTNRPFLGPDGTHVGVYEPVGFVDGVPRIGAFRRVRGMPLVVLALLSKEEALAASIRARNWTLIGGAFTTLLTLAGVLLLARAGRRQARLSRTLALQEERWRLALQAVGDGVWDWNVATNTVYFSPGWAALFGDPAGDRTGTMLDWSDRIHPDDRNAALDALDEHLAGHTPLFEHEHRLNGSDGRERWVLDRGIVLARDATGSPVRVIGTLTDISQRKRLEDMLHGQATALAVANSRLERLVTTDALTGVASRRALVEQSQRLLTQDSRQGLPVAVIMVDIDHFKLVNDNHGHAAGDEVLRIVASRCAARLRREDLFGRWGGEEFVAILPDTEPAGAMQVAEDLRRVIAGTTIPLTGGVTVSVTASLGVATSSRRGTATLDALLQRADAAMYRAKQSGRNRVCPGDDGPGDAERDGPALRQVGGTP